MAEKVGRSKSWVIMLVMATLISSDRVSRTLSQAWFAVLMPAIAAVFGALFMAPDTHHLSMRIGAGLITLGAVYAMGNMGNMGTKLGSASRASSPCLRYRRATYKHGHWFKPRDVSQIARGER